AAVEAGTGQMPLAYLTLSETQRRAVREDVRTKVLPYVSEGRGQMSVEMLIGRAGGGKPRGTIAGGGAKGLQGASSIECGLFYEHQLPQPWAEESELRLYQQALDQIELADRLGIDYVWEVEHHFLEEYSHSSAPEVFLAACSQRT